MEPTPAPDPRFTDWETPVVAARAAPQRPGLFQVKVRDGMVDYPRGRSPLIFSCRADQLAGGISAFREKILPKWEQSEEQVLVRWLPDEDSISRHEIVLRDFETEYGSQPIKN